MGELTTASTNQRPTRTRFVVLVWLCAAAALAYLCRNAISVAESTVRHDLGLTKQQSGWLMSGFFLSYALFSIPAAQIGQRAGSRRALPLFAIVWSLATAATALVSGLVGFLAARIVQGAAQAGLFPTITVTIAKWIPMTGRAFATGALGSFMSVGGALCAWLTGVLLEAFEPRVAAGWNWRLTFLLFAVPGIVWAVGFWWWFRDEPSEHRAVNKAELEAIQQAQTAQPELAHPATSLSELPLPRSERGRGSGRGGAPISREQLSEPERPPLLGPLLPRREEREIIVRDPVAVAGCAQPERPFQSPQVATSALPTPWLPLLSSPAMWWLCGQQMFRAAGYIFFTSWFATYLQETRGVGIAHSGFLNMLPLVAVVAAGMIGGALSDWLLKRTASRSVARRWLSILSQFACAGMIIWALVLEDALTAVLVFSAGSFFASLASPCAYAMTIDMGGSHVATVNATMNMMGNFGALAFPVAVPWLLERFGNWDAVLVVFGALYVVGALFWLLLKPEGSIFEQALCRDSVNRNYAPAVHY